MIAWSCNAIEDYYITPHLDEVIFQIIPDTSVEALVWKLAKLT